MKKILVYWFLSLCVQSVFADNYGGVGVGLSEACRTKYEPSFAGGDCIEPNLDFRGLVGHQVNEYFAIEASLDAAIDAGTTLDFVLGEDDPNSFFYDPEITTNRWSILTLGVHAFGYLPLTDSFRLFAGPSIAGSIVNFDYDVTYFGNPHSRSNSSTEFGLNYGWAAGIDFLNNRNGFVRVQWQNWRSMDANLPENSEFNTNSLTLNWVGYF